MDSLPVACDGRSRTRRGMGRELAAHVSLRHRRGRPGGGRVEPVAPEGPRRLGVLADQGAVPDDYDQIGADEIVEAFGR